MDAEERAVFEKVNPFPHGTRVRHRARVPALLKRMFGIGQSLQSVTLSPAGDSLWHCLAATVNPHTCREYMMPDGRTSWERKERLALVSTRDYVENTIRRLFKEKSQPLLRVLQQRQRHQQRQHICDQLFYASVAFNVNIVVCDTIHGSGGCGDDDEQTLNTFVYFPTCTWDETQADRDTLLLLTYADTWFSVCSVNHAFLYRETSDPERFVPFGTVNKMAKEQLKARPPNVASLFGKRDRETWCALRGMEIADLERMEYKKTLMTKHTKLELLSLVNERTPAESQEHASGRKKLSKSELADLLLFKQQ
jgi:hypothetical protein